MPARELEHDQQFQEVDGGRIGVDMGDIPSKGLYDVDQIKGVFDQSDQIREMQGYFEKWTKRINTMIGDKN
eukprot:CAMPEP_0205807230 /NCGR_PEP_ID=MMETSP0205-20121125/10943_1 /ASSEMBLY_ACC=CAM_ASM_000278 /TAXON_ID=36767 /ORGANISM="Euplotes focardii, Strain TN1" /LENGTH=70 /DNA_ID=CAMNT_0053081219 /DNA_START=757 /DNA_END=966 /DNA_ORIENTATION=+